MSYSKQEWVNNISTADQERMNHIEDGIYENSVQIEILQEETSQINSGLLGISNILGFDTYDNTKTYSLGEYCLYNNILYKCIVAITIAENWNEEHWSETNIREEMEQKILWAGTPQFMNEQQTITLNKKISQQNKGIVLVWSAYSNNEAKDWFWNYNFVPKEIVNLGITGSTFILAGGGFESIASKYLYIYDNRISGNERNNKTGTNNGITWANNSFVLRYVIGV